MDNFNRNTHKNKRSKPFSATLITLLMFCMVLFSGSLVSAVEFDNVREYDTETRTITVTNAFGLGDKIADIKLDSNLNQRVGLGYQRVAEFTVTNIEDYTDALKQIEFYDTTDNLRSIERTFDYRVKTITNTSINDYTRSCDTLENGTETNCILIISGTHQEDRVTWEILSETSLLSGEYTIGVYTNVLKGDVVEWIPTFYGIEIVEWAVWTAGLDVGLVSYWTLDQLTGNMLDVAVGGGNDLIANTTPVRGVNGLIRTAVRFDSNGDSFEKDAAAPNLDFGSTQDFSISFWVNRSTTFSADGPYFQSGDSVPSYSTSYTSTNVPSFSVSTNEGPGDANRLYVTSDGGLARDPIFHHIALIRNDSGTDLWLFIDGVYNASTQSAFTHDAAALNPRIGPDAPRFSDGSTDEFGIWNRSLTFAEVTQLYNGGFGISPINSTLVNLNAPLDSSSSSTSLTLFNATGFSGEGESIVNMTLWTNESGLWEAKNETTIIGNSVVVQTWNRDMPEGYFIWNSQVCDSANLCIFAEINRTLTIDAISPSITITRPVALIDYSRIGTIQPVNFTITDSILDTCWYDYNATNYTFSCSSGVPGTFNISIESGKKSITLYANDTAGNVGSATQAWNYKVFENNITFNSTSYETASETFTLNVSANSSLTAVTLNYDGTDYPTTLASNISTVTFDVPPGIGNKSYYYKFSYAGETFNSNTRNQSIGETTFALCNATYTVPYINYTFANENDESELNASISASNFTYYLGGGSQVKSLIFSNVTENQAYAFCVSPVNKTLHLDPRIQYEAVGYPQRVYQPSIFDITNATTNTTLYLLATADGIYVTFQVINTAEQLLTDVFVNSTRLIGASQQIVGEGFTDSSGGVTMWLNPNFVHNFVFSKTGYSSLTTSFAPTQTAYTITLGGVSAITNRDYTKGITFRTYPDAPLKSLFNDTVYNFNYTVGSSIFTIDQFGFTLFNEDNDVLGSASSLSNGGFIGLNLNTVDNETIVMEYWYIINGTQLNSTRYWNVQNSLGTNYSIKNLFIDLSAYMASGMFGLGDFGFKVIVFFSIFLFVGVVSFKYGFTGQKILSLFIFSVVYWVDFGLNLIPNVAGISHFPTFIMAIITLGVLTEGFKF